MSTSTAGRVATPPTRTARTQRKRGRRVYTRKQRWIIGVINITAFFVLWQVAATTTDIPQLFLPSVTDVFRELTEMHEEGILWNNLAISAWIYVVGMAISIAIAVPLGLFIGGVPAVDRIAAPYVWAIYTTPRLILMPLVLLWVGINDTARVVIIVLSAVPATMVVVMEGVKTVDSSLLRAARSFGAGRVDLFRFVVLPSTVPFVATGIRMGVSRGLIGLFIGELFTAANGIGYIITLASKTFNSARTYGMLLIFILFCVAMVGLSQLLERKASVWRAQNT
ncbi:MAG TPA: ABC transporter permease [Jiangellaceae bacterium]|jgi:NitT/TauT family transport system permease protein|nr:ABC transporter permease [Jiangellaceae bacterium]